MPYRRRYGRRRPHRRRNTRRRSKSRRHTTGFKTRSRFTAKTARGRKAVRRAGKIACPVVYECLKKIADHNIVWCLKDCEGLMTTTFDKFATSEAYTAVQGPFSLGTGEAIDRCGYLGLNIYTNPVNLPYGGLMTTAMVPSSIRYEEQNLDFNVFPLLAMTNPTVAAIINSSNARDSSDCMVNYWDNRHSLRITWPFVSGSGDAIYTMMKYNKLILWEVCYWVPDLSTIIDNSLVVKHGDVTTVANAQVELRKQRSWLRQMFNAKFCTHPMADALLAIGGAGADVVDIVTGPPVNAFDTFQEPVAGGSRIQNNRIKPRSRDTLEFLAAGVVDRRKDASVKWVKKRTFHRPKMDYGRFGSARASGLSTIAAHDGGIPISTTGNNRVAVSEAGANDDLNSISATTITSATSNCTNVCLPFQVQTVKCGRRFNIDKKMMWEHTVPDALPESDIREVCPRGVFVYAKYWFYDPGLPDSDTASSGLSPDISAAFTGMVDKTWILKFQNI